MSTVQAGLSIAQAGMGTARVGMGTARAGQNTAQAGQEHRFRPGRIEAQVQYTLSRGSAQAQPRWDGTQAQPKQD